MLRLGGIRWSRGAWVLLVGACASAWGASGEDGGVNLRTALVRSVETKSLGEKHGLYRLGVEGLIKQCNTFREAKGLPPRSPPDAMLEEIDKVDHVYAYDGRRRMALNEATIHLLRLDDYERFMRSGLTGAIPDCGVATPFTDKHATIWREGARYDLNYQKMTAQRMSSRPGDVSPQHLPAWPIAGRADEMVAGQACSMQSVPSVPGILGGPEQCLLRGFDEIGWLNLPLALKRTVILGGGQGLKGEETASSAEVDVPLPENLFTIPPGFTVRDAVGRH